MHDTAYKTGQSFFELYWKPDFHNIVDFGAGNVNGSLRDHCPPGAEYTGLDMEAGPGVDVCIRPYEPLPLSDEFADVVVASSVFEHDELFWQTFLELARITRKGGFIYINAPSNGSFHRYPVDCWRFYPDAGSALAKWACRSGLDVELVESCIIRREGEEWNDFVAIFHRKGDQPLAAQALVSDRHRCLNVKHGTAAEIRDQQALTEDVAMMQAGLHELNLQTSRVAALDTELAAERAALAATQDQLDLMQVSTSWRVTAPLRTARSYLLHMKGRAS